MNQLLEFVRRLTLEGYRHHAHVTEGGVTIYCAPSARERWEVTFGAHGSTETAIFLAGSTMTSSDPTATEGLFDRMAKAWREASRDLQIRFTSPFSLLDPSGIEVKACGFLPDFGGPKGTLVASRADSDCVLAYGDALGFFCPGLAPETYEQYDRRAFIDTLRDWGWFGAPDAAPTWLQEG